ncbi:MAG TPA: type II toxin-antitoxin system Phd/YefM family antitoxin [Anaerolineales bacterium]|nr:type II toxin-antitoxin system Phd/YefM family antitoxin [Anaerolineales bacterium]
MDKIIGVTELQRKFRAVFEEVVKKHTPYILTRGSHPEAVLIPYEQYLRFLRADEAGVLKRIDDALAYMTRVNAQYADDEIEADLKEATRIVRSRKVAA